MLCMVVNNRCISTFLSNVNKIANSNTKSQTADKQWKYSQRIKYSNTVFIRTPTPSTKIAKLESRLSRGLPNLARQINQHLIFFLDHLAIELTKFSYFLPYQDEQYSEKS